MPLPKGFTLIRTGAVAGEKTPVGYAQGTSDPPNGGQVMDVDNPEANDAISLPKGFRLEQPTPAGLNAPLPGVPSAPVPAGLTGAPTLMQTLNVPALALDAGDVGIGALKGAGHTLDNIGNVATLGLTSRPALKFYNRHLGTDFNIPTDEQEAAPFAPSNGFQSAGKGIEQAAEFLIPGLGEEAAGAKLAELVPGLGRAAAPLGRIAVSTLGGGAVNSLQGGAFGTGAAMGGIAGGVGEGLKALAPAVAESAMGVRKLDRAYGKTPGRAILDETTGFSPTAVAQSAQDRLDELNPELERIAARASARPNNIAGLLSAPTQEIPLGTPFVPKMPGEILPAEPFPVENVAQTRVIRNGQGQILPRSERMTAFPNEKGVMAPARNPYNGRMLPQKIENLPFTREAFMAGDGEELPPVIDQRIGPGVLLRRAEGGTGPIPTVIPNTSASLAGARGVVNSAIGKATARNAGKEVGQLRPLSDFLTQRFDTGAPIPANVTPSELLNLRRGFADEFVHNWNPEVMPGVTGTARNAYHALTDELHNVVPETRPLDARISSLIPVAKRAESRALNAPLAQRLAGRLAAHTGALTGTIGGGLFGYERGGVGGALKGAAAGMLIPEVLANPSFEMGIARGFNSPALRRGLLPLAVGGSLQATRSDRDKTNKNKQ